MAPVVTFTLHLERLEQSLSAMRRFTADAAHASGCKLNRPNTRCAPT
jgi:hypothetical protein